MIKILQTIIFVIGLVACITGLNVLIGGSSAISGASSGAEAAIDNELRFFSVFWLSYGIFCFWIAYKILDRKNFIPFIALVFFAGGVGRLLSLALVGNPGVVLFGAMILELVLPIAIYLIYRKSAL